MEKSRKIMTGDENHREIFSMISLWVGFIGEMIYNLTDSNKIFHIHAPKNAETSESFEGRFVFFAYECYCVVLLSNCIF